MSYTIDSQVLGDMKILPNANVQEVNSVGAMIHGTTTDANGKFKLTATSDNALIKVSHVGYLNTLVNARDFESYIDLVVDPNQLNEVEVVSNKKDNTLSIILGTIAAVLLVKKIFGKKETAQKVRV